jgi:hypothetical protein
MHIFNAVFRKVGLSPTFLVAEYPESECLSRKMLIDDSYLSLECGFFVGMVVVVNECY